MDGNVQFLRLKSGEDLITEVEETETTYVLLNPCKVLYLKGTGTNFLSISLMQWVLAKICSEQIFEIDKREVLLISDPDTSLIDHYWNSVEYFINVQSKKSVSYDSEPYEEVEDEAVDDITSTEDAIDLLKELLNTKPDKGKLH